MAVKPSLTPKDLIIPPKILEQTDNTAFTCGNNDIDYFIQREALVFQQKRLGITYLFLHESELIGFATLCMGHLNKQKIAAKDRLKKHVKSYPALLIGQLAVCSDQQDKWDQIHL